MTTPLEQMTPEQLQADLPGWDGASAPLPAGSSGPSDEPSAPAQRRRGRGRSQGSTSDAGDAQPSSGGPSPAADVLASLIDPNDPATAAALGGAAGSVFVLAGRVLHQLRTPERAYGPNRLWLVTDDERKDLTGPAGSLLARHLPAAWLAAMLPVAGMVGDSAEVGGVLSAYAMRNRTDEAQLRELIRDELARQAGQLQANDGGPTG